MKAQRWMLGGLATVMLVAALMLYLSRGLNDSGAYLTGILSRVGIVLLTIFLAWPTLEKNAERIPAFLTGAVLLGLLFFAIRPKLLPLILVLVVAVSVVHFGLRFVSKRLDR